MKEKITAKLKELQEELNKIETVISNSLQEGIHPTNEALEPYTKLYELFEKQKLELKDMLEAIS